MPLLLILAFPLAEIATFIAVGGAIGIVRTLALVAVSSVVGFVMLRDAGILTAMRLQRQSANQAAVLAEGGTRMLAGLLLLIPGFLTDIAALMLLVPSVRKFLQARAPQPRRDGDGAPHAANRVIDGDFRRLKD